MKRLNSFKFVVLVIFVIELFGVMPGLTGEESPAISVLGDGESHVLNEQQPASVVQEASLPFSEQQTGLAEKLLADVVKDKSKNINIERIQKVMLAYMLDLQKKQEDERRHILELLPESDRALIVKARENYEMFLNEVNLTSGLAHACTTVSVVVQEALKNDTQRTAQLQPIIFRLDTLHKGLIDGCFIGILNNGQARSANNVQVKSATSLLAAMDLGMDFQADGSSYKKDSPGGTLTQKDLVDLIEMLNHVEIVTQELKNKEFERAWKILHAMLTCVAHNDVRGLTAGYMEYLRPYIDTAQKILNEVTAELNKKIVKLNLEGDRERRRAYVLLTRELTGYQRTLMVFASLERDASSLVSHSHTMFTLIAYSFDFYKTIYSFYKRDYETYRWREGILDTGLRSAIATWHFFIQKSDFSNGLLFNTIQGNSPVASLDPLQLLMFNATLAPFALMVFFDPGFWNKQFHGSVRELGKIVSSWVYYHIFHCWLFDDAVPGEESFLDHYDGIDSVWPRDYKFLRGTIYHALTEGQRYVFKQLSMFMRMHVYPEAIEKIENATMGIVRPELIGYIVETMLPLVMLDRRNFVNKVIHCRPDDVYSADFNFRIRDLCAKECFVRPSTAYDPQHVTAEWNLYNQHMAWCNAAPVNAVFSSYARNNHYDVDIKAYYVECQLMSYVFTSVGSHWGRFFAKKYQKALGRFVSYSIEKTINACAKVGIMSNETAEMFKAAQHEFSEGLEETVTMLKELLAQIFVPGSSMRAMIIPILERRGDIDVNDNVDSAAVTRDVLNVVLLFLAEHALISYLDVEVIESSFDKDPTNTKALIDTLVNLVRSNLIATVGGRAGATLSSWIGSCVMSYTGPLYPKVSAYMH